MKNEDELERPLLWWHWCSGSDELENRSLRTRINTQLQVKVLHSKSVIVSKYYKIKWLWLDLCPDIKCRQQLPGLWGEPTFWISGDGDDPHRWLIVLLLLLLPPPLQVIVAALTRWSPGGVEKQTHQWRPISMSTFNNTPKFSPGKGHFRYHFKNAHA